MPFVSDDFQPTGNGFINLQVPGPLLAAWGKGPAWLPGMSQGPAWAQGPALGLGPAWAQRPALGLGCLGQPILGPACEENAMRTHVECNRKRLI